MSNVEDYNMKIEVIKTITDDQIKASLGSGKLFF
jgi:hypothetical protein